MHVRHAFLALSLATVIAPSGNAQSVQRLTVSANHRFLQRADGSPFFWLGDTGWLLFSRLDRAATLRYLDDRRAKGFNDDMSRGYARPGVPGPRVEGLRTSHPVGAAPGVSIPPPGDANPAPDVEGGR